MKSSIIKVPIIAQCNSSGCGVACVQSLLGYYKFHVLQEDLSNELKLDKNNGVRISNIIKFLTQNGYTCDIRNNATISMIKHFIDKRIPILTVYQAWRNKQNTDWKNIWNSGHFSIIVGIDNRNIYMMDPLILGNYGFIPIDEFIERWHDYDDNAVYDHWICGVNNNVRQEYVFNVFERIN